MSRGSVTGILAWFAFLVFSCLLAKAQEGNTLSKKKDNKASDSLTFSSSRDLPDSLGSDSLVFASDSLRSDSTKAKKKGPIETTVNYSARDSIRMDVINRRAYLFGKAHADYGEIKLDAGFILIDYKNNMVIARGVPNDSSGELEELPVFLQGNDRYDAEEIRYNLKTKKAVVMNVRTEQGEGVLNSDTVIKIDDNTILAKGNTFSPCLLPEPNYYIRADKIKLIRNDKIVASKWNVYLGDVPTPIGFLFGIFPQPKTNANGLIIPTYGESRDRGFFLRNGGYYFTVGDYVATKVLGEIYSKGGYGFNLLSNYKLRYRFDGNVEVRYNRRITGDAGVDRVVNEDYWFTWSHAPVARGNSRFSANVNLGSNNYNRLNSFNTNNFLSTQFRSSVKYSLNIPNTPFNVAVTMNQTQNTQTGVWRMDLPTANVGMQRIFPFKPKDKPSKTMLHKLGVSYNMSVAHPVSNDKLRALSVNGIPNLLNYRTPLMDSILPVRSGNFENIIKRGDPSINHTVNISTSGKTLKYLNWSPSFNYIENWFHRRLEYKYLPDRDSVKPDTVNGLSRAYQFNMAVNLQTRVYGMYNINGKRLEKIRHTINPNASFSYTPDFSNPMWGQYSDVQINETGQTVKASPFALTGYGGAPRQESGNLSFGVTNTIEAKVKEKKNADAPQKPEDEGEKKKPTTKKITLLDNLSASSGYDLIRKEFKLNPIALSTRVNLLKMININLNGTVDPYYYDSLNRRINRYAWHRGQGLGRLTNASVAFQTSLNPNTLTGQKSKMEQKREKGDLSPLEEQQLAWMIANPDLYVDWDVPWNLSVSYNVQYSKGANVDKGSIIQTMNFSGDVSLTPKWKIGYTSGYDFKRRDISFTSFNIYRDMHCWEMRVMWIPFGVRQSYSVEINAKASMLKDLKLSRRRSWYDR